MRSSNNREDVQTLISLESDKKDDGNLGLFVTFNICFDKNDENAQKLTPGEKANKAMEAATDAFRQHCELRRVHPSNPKKPFKLKKEHVNQYVLTAFCLPNDKRSLKEIEKSEHRLSIVDSLDKKDE